MALITFGNFGKKMKQNDGFTLIVDDDRSWWRLTSGAGSLYVPARAPKNMRQNSGGGR